MAFYEDAVKKRNHVRNTRNEEWEEEKSQYRNGRESETCERQAEPAAEMQNRRGAGFSGRKNGTNGDNSG